MRSDVKELIIFAGGLIVGAAESWFACKKYYSNKAEEEIESVEKAFNDRLNDIEKEKDGALDVAEKALLSANEYNKEDPGSRELIKNRSTLEGIIKSKGYEKVDYVQYSNPPKNSAEAIEVDDHPHDDEPEEEEDDGRDNGIFEVGNGRDNIKEPYEISYKEYGSMPTYDFKDMYYYKSDGVVVEVDGESEEIIDNPEYLFGNVLEKSGFKTNDEKTIYVRNEYISCDFEIMKVFGTYA